MVKSSPLESCITCGNLAGIRKMHHLSDGGLGALFVLFSSSSSCAVSKAENGGLLMAHLTMRK